MSKYTALTIGPLYKTFSLAKKTREMWGASFIFSILMKKIIEQIINDGNRKENIIIPYSFDYPELEAVGLYSDHLLYEGELPKIKAYIEKAISKLAEMMAKNSSENAINDFSKVLTDYMQVYYFSSETIEEVQGNNYIDKLNFILSSMELSNKVTSAEIERKIGTFMKFLPSTKLFADHFVKFYDSRTKSLVEIATAELSKITEYDYTAMVKEYIEKDIENSDTDFLNTLKQKTVEVNKGREENARLQSFNKYHKYIAVLYGDGDKMGKMIGEVVKNKTDLSDIHNVSDTLFKWAKEASGKIKDFGGMPVYAGGDDLLFFAPIVNGGVNIITVLEEISKDFSGRFNELFSSCGGVTIPTLSFGVSITYYKYPLNEAISEAYNLIQAMKKDGGNGINLRMLKHSGSDFEFMMQFDKMKDEKYEIFRSLMSYDLNETMLSSTAYHLKNNVMLLNGIGTDKTRMKNFFSNKMEGYPKQVTEKTKHYLLEVEKLVNLTCEMNDESSKNDHNSMNTVFDMLRLVKFLKGLDKDN